MFMAQPSCIRLVFCGIERGGIIRPGDVIELLPQ